VAFAAAEADRHADKLTAIYAWNAPEPWGTLPSVAPTVPLEEDRLILAEAIAGLADEYPDLEIVSQVIGGRPLRALYAAAVGARMLVVGSHGKHGFTKAMLGSVSEDVILSVPCPVVVVRA
jgi:nucleotide-binding universal stress UspA family protein